MEVRVGPRVVHVVDDNATFRKTIEGRLKQFGYEVVTYPSAVQLLDRLPTRQYTGLYPSGRAAARNERTGAARAPERTRFDAANFTSQRLL